MSVNYISCLRIRLTHSMAINSLRAKQLQWLNGSCKATSVTVPVCSLCFPFHVTDSRVISVPTTPACPELTQAPPAFQPLDVPDSLTYLLICFLSITHIHLHSIFQPISTHSWTHWCTFLDSALCLHLFPSCMVFQAACCWTLAHTLTLPSARKEEEEDNLYIEWSVQYMYAEWEIYKVFRLKYWYSQSKKNTPVGIHTLIPTVSC